MQYSSKMIVQCTIVVALIPAVFGDQKPFWVEDKSQFNPDNYFSSLVGKDDENGWSYMGITTFAHLPFINCLDPTYADEANEQFDIAIVGAPFDTSVTYRPGYFALQDSLNIGLVSDQLGLD